MISYSDLKKGIAFILEGEPYEVQDAQFVRMQQRKPVMQTKIRNLITGKTVSRNFHQNEVFKEAEINDKEMIFLFSHRDQYTFIEPGNPKDRVVLGATVVGDIGRFFKKNLPVTFQMFSPDSGSSSLGPSSGGASPLAGQAGGEEKIIGIKIPMKIEYAVKEAQPADKGNTVQGGSKEAVLENGLIVQVPLFINTGDVIKVNTETGEYSERMEKK